LTRAGEEEEEKSAVLQHARIAPPLDHSSGECLLLCESAGSGEATDSGREREEQQRVVGDSLTAAVLLPPSVRLQMCFVHTSRPASTSTEETSDDAAHASSSGSEKKDKRKEKKKGAAAAAVLKAHATCEVSDAA
jgi:hypothetical protein